MLLTPHARRHATTLLICLLFSFTSQADTLSLGSTSLDGHKLPLLPYLMAWEDPGHESDTSILSNGNIQFVPVQQLKRQSPISFYWLQLWVNNTTTATSDMMLHFSSLTFVELYLYQNGQCILHKKAGAFREKEYIAPHDGRIYANVLFQPGQRYQIVLKVHHTKHYQPTFDFALQEKNGFLEQKRKNDLVHAWSQGAVCIFIFYTLLSWLVSRFRPYIWLLCYMTGLGLYGMGSAGYLIDWIFPNNPINGWIFNLNFAHLGSFGIYMLILDFWEVKKYNPTLYKVGMLLVVKIIVMTIVGYVIDSLTGNFKLVNTINLWTAVFPFSFIIGSLIVCWRRLTIPQRYLAYGLMLFFCSGAFVVVTAALFREGSLFNGAYVSNFTTLGVFLLFATGLKEELRQHEVAKLAAQQELNTLQQHQNTMLEKMVEDRTAELRISNRRLIEQKVLLGERNSKIEILINELNHRVKNNLQMLYSLNSLQVPLVAGEESRGILRSNMGKIKAMMLVNQRLLQFEEQSPIQLKDFTQELCANLQSIYDTKGKTRIMQDIAPGIHLQGKKALSFGLILSELLTNSFKYAFAQQHTDPVIRISVLQVNTEVLQFTYSDNGKGIDKNQEGDRMTMGLALVQDLTRQMNGKLTTENGLGLTYHFIIPV